MTAARNIILAGFMGTGKSSVGQALARRLGWSFADADEIIEARAGRKISKIFEEEGETGFRAIEAQVARDLADVEHYAIATGGGMVLSEANRRSLEAAGALVLLEASEATIWARVKDERHRPLLEVDDPQGRIHDLLTRRRPIYGLIEKKVTTDSKSVEAIVEEVLRLVGLG
jgi:shikimate kinase